MSLCPTDCTDFDQVEIKNDACELGVRKANLRAIGFYKCDTVIPNPLTEASLTALLAPTAPALPGAVISNELANVQIGEPQMTQTKISDSRPELEVIESREITFQDRIKVDVTVLSQTVFKDYDFWRDKKEHATRLNYFLVMSDGRVIVPREDNSNNGMAASFGVFLNYETQQGGGGIEFKQGKLKFLGDPFDMSQSTVNLNNIPALAGKW